MTESGRTMSPEQLIALNDEIAQLILAGVPLELGLRSLGRNVPAVLGRVSRDLATRLQGGESLSSSLERSIPGLPRVYIAAVEAGMKAGELPRVLELLTRFMQQALELRQRIEFAFLYPLMVFLLAYSLLAACVIESAERWTEIWGDAALQQSWLLSVYQSFCFHWAYWIWIAPTLVGVFIISWFGFVRRSLLPDHRPSRLLHLIPGMVGVVKTWHWSIFCETAALLIEHHVPFPVALRLAGATTGNPIIESEMERLAHQLEQGESVSSSLRGRNVIPPFLTWSLSHSLQPESLLNALRQAAEIYHQRAAQRCDMIKKWLPLLLITVIGGGAVFIYALSCVIPIMGLFSELGQESEISM